MARHWFGIGAYVCFVLLLVFWHYFAPPKIPVSFVEAQSTYLFVAPLFLLAQCLVALTHRYFPQSVVYALMFLPLLKAGLTIWYLFPEGINTSPGPRFFVLHFFALYFVSLLWFVWVGLLGFAQQKRCDKRAKTILETIKKKKAIKKEKNHNQFFKKKYFCCATVKRK